MSDIVVIGSINMDLVVRASRMPAAGETIAGHDFQLVPGGKGANQAVAAARMAEKNGSRVSMIGRVGADTFGRTLREALAQEGIDTAHVRADETAGTGTASIVVDDTGENRIIVVAGANGRVNEEDLKAAAPLIAAAKVLVLQFEIPLETVKQALKMARRAGVSVVLNPAPAYKLPAGFLNGVDVLIMNETESAVITGIPVTDIQTAKQAAVMLHENNVGAAIFTLGADGAIISQGQEAEHVEGHSVRVLDTTAAGDAFVGAFVASMAREKSLRQAVQQANAAGALAVTQFGAQPSLPTAAEVHKFLTNLSTYP